MQRYNKSILGPRDVLCLQIILRTFANSVWTLLLWNVSPTYLVDLFNARPLNQMISINPRWLLNRIHGFRWSLFSVHQVSDTTVVKKVSSKSWNKELEIIPPTQPKTLRLTRKRGWGNCLLRNILRETLSQCVFLLHVWAHTCTCTPLPSSLILWCR